MEGFVVFNYAARYAEALREMAGWRAAGKLKSREDVVAGLETFPETLLKLFTGENFGKLVLKVADDLSFAAIQHRANLLCVLRALAVAGNQFNLLGAAHADFQLHGARNLLLIEDRALAHFRRGAKVPQQRHAHGVNGHAVCSGKNHVGLHHLALVGAAVGKRLYAIQQNQVRFVRRY